MLRLVAVVSGRPVAFLREHLPVPGLVLAGVYGLERLVGDEVVTDPRAAAHLGTGARRRPGRRPHAGRR